MRDTTRWYQAIEGELRRYWPSGNRHVEGREIIFVSLRDLCDVELALVAHQRLMPNAPITGLWALLTGSPLPFAERKGWSDREMCMIAVLRHYLAHLKNPYRWKQQLQRYRAVAARLRLFDVSDDLERCEMRELSICVERLACYGDTLERPPRYLTMPSPSASSGEYTYSDGNRTRTLILSDTLLRPTRPQGHSLAGTPARTPIRVTHAELLSTAAEMDRIWRERGYSSPPNWETRFRRIRPEVWAAAGAYEETETITLDGLRHIVGMVSSGKSTFMEVLAYWAAGRDLRITIIISNVIGVLDLAERLARLDVSVAPVLGASRRERHINSLHRVLAQRTPAGPLSIGAHRHVGWQWLGSVCLLDALRARELRNPFAVGQEPCTRLRPLLEQNNGSIVEGAESCCPFYGVCPRHQDERDLVGARVWVATMAGLIYGGVPRALNAERARLFELMAKRSDLIIVDEADLVQTQLDTAFSPSQVLTGPADAFLDMLTPHVNRELQQQRRRQLRDPEGAMWVQTLRRVESASDRVYELLQQEAALSDEWVHYQYFTDKILLDQIAQELSGRPVTRRGKRRRQQSADSMTDRQKSVYQTVQRQFNAFLDGLYGRRSRIPRELDRLAQDAVSGAAAIRPQLRAWLDQLAPEPLCSEQELEQCVVRLEFALIVAVLANRLNNLVQYWRQVENLFSLDGRNSALVHRPPADYTPLIPEAPMGNVLGFQYTRPAKHIPGDLSFFRCAGIGRWLLLHLDELFAFDHVAGPHVLLLSGTSWAGTSPHYDIQRPVAMVLDMPPFERQAIEESTLEFLTFRYPADTQRSQLRGRPITVSGLPPGERRQNALEALVRLLSERAESPFDASPLPSRLERERDQLEPDRRRILLLVGSYAEANFVVQALLSFRKDWIGQVKLLVSDDESFESSWVDPAHTQRRGDVDHFADDPDAWVLVAPLKALERGHNILNADGVAAFGAAYFLVRPHPRPQDIDYAIHAINRWAIANYARASDFADGRAAREFATGRRATPEATAADMGIAFRRMAQRQWYRLMSLHLSYSTIGPHDREALIWSQLVSIWQVIGRLVRGGRKARVYFIDAAFAPRTAHASDERDPADKITTSLLLGMRAVLRPYCDPVCAAMERVDMPPGLPSPTEEITPQMRALVQKLYGPFYTALLHARVREE